MLAFGDPDLRLDDVEPGDDLGHRMLDLDARIDLDEVEFAGVGVDQEFDRAGADIFGRAADLQRRLAEPLARGLVEIGRRRALDHLLVAALDRTVALEEMHEIAMRIAEDLHLDMARAAHQLFEIDLILAEGVLGLALGAQHGVDELVLALDRSHAAPAAAPGGLEHDRIADLGGEALDLLRVVRQRRRRRHDRRAEGDRDVARRDLVAEIAHRLRRRADEDDAGRGAGLGEFRTSPTGSHSRDEWRRPWPPSRRE